MGHGLQSNDPTISAAFHTALMHQFLIIALLTIALMLAWNTIRTINFRRAAAAGNSEASTPVGTPYPEPMARRVLRITFGTLWVFDGILQLQGSMPLGLPGSVLTPAASSSPGWVQHIVNVGTTIWSNHPVSAAAAVVWIQIGIGAFLLVAPRGYWSRAAGAVSAGWGLIVWVFGEAFGGLFGHGSSWLFGSPGAVLLYVVAGLLIMLRESAWETPRLGRSLLRGMGVFFLAMGVLQAWPGRGFWSGQTSPATTPGTLTSMVRQMAQVPQPTLFSSWLRSFGSFEAAHGWGVNLVAVLCLVGIGLCFVSGRRELARVGVMAGAVLCLADWIFVQDFGFLGGVGTDPNSMIPTVAIFTTGYLAMVRLPAPAPSPAVDGSAQVVPTPARLLDRLSPSYLLRWLAAVGAVGIVLVGAAPMALASTNPNADPILAQSSDGTPNVVNYPAPSFTLTDQHGHRVSLPDLAGHTVVLAFLDPVCVSDCPLIAQELRVADQLLGASASSVDFVSIVNNPLYRSRALVNAFDQQEGLDRMANWQYLTGPLADLHQVWTSYGVQTEVTPAGAMVAHSDIAYIIDRHGRVREILSDNPGATAASHSSFSVLLSNQVQQIARS
jgi:cytochrome oxidase Cu insertion factor (SCO1/SenC/PrrC family)